MLYWLYVYVTFSITVVCVFQLILCISIFLLCKALCYIDEKALYIKW